MLVLLACVCRSHPDIAPQRPPARPGLEPFLSWLPVGRNCLPSGSRFDAPMPELTRRRSLDAPDECWHVYYGDVVLSEEPSEGVH